MRSVLVPQKHLLQEIHFLSLSISVSDKRKDSWPLLKEGGWLILIFNLFPSGDEQKRQGLYMIEEIFNELVSHDHLLAFAKAEALSLWLC